MYCKLLYSTYIHTVCTVHKLIYMYCTIFFSTVSCLMIYPLFPVENRVAFYCTVCTMYCMLASNGKLNLLYYPSLFDSLRSYLQHRLGQYLLYSLQYSVTVRYMLPTLHYITAAQYCILLYSILYCNVLVLYSVVLVIYKVSNHNESMYSYENSIINSVQTDIT